MMPAEQAVNLPVGLSALQHPAVDLPGFQGPIEVVALAGEPLIDGRYDINEVVLGAPFVS